jgi:hypothetical protein
MNRFLLPQAVAPPQPLATVNGGEDGPKRTDPASGNEIDPHTGFVQGTEDPGMVRTGGAGAGQDERGAKARRVLAIRSVWCDHRQADRGLIHCEWSKAW